MELKQGLKFKKYYNENNINNIDLCEVRGIVNDFIIVLYCKKRKKDKYGFYKTIDVTNFEYNLEMGTYILISEGE